MSLLAVTDVDAFAVTTAALMKELGRGCEISAIARDRYGHMSGELLVSFWRERFTALAKALSSLDARTRLPWYGPTMSARSFATARMMETWAHGQDIYDALGQRRHPSDRIRHIAHIGVTTFGWSFLNRKLPVPEPVPYIELESPSGEKWTWNDPSSEHYIRGTAEDFCMVVTQRRNVVDTKLHYAGDAAQRWLAIAQCFAGPPENGPAPGVRAVAY